MENKQLLKQLSSAGTGKATSAPAGKGASGVLSKLKAIPGVEQVSKAAKNTKPKQVVDVVIFSVGIYLMYKFGRSVAETIDNQMPTEKSMMEMMRSMQGPPGMPPPPM